MIDLNKELGIEVDIPDPLKRETGTRRFGFGHQRNRRIQSQKRYRSARDQYDRRKHDNRKKGRNYYGLKSRW